MPTLLRLALRDLRHQRRFALFFVANLALGLAGSITLDSLQHSVTRAIVERSRTLLGGDLRVASNSPLDAALLELVHREAEPVAEASVVQMYSMVRGGEGARLVEVRAIDAGFPLAGAIVLERRGLVGAEARRALAAQGPLAQGQAPLPEAWADPALLGQLGVAVGDTVDIGAQRFRIGDVLARDTGLAVRAMSLAPRLYVGMEHVEGTGLVRTGSRVEYQKLWSLPPGTDARRVAARLRQFHDDPGVAITSHEEAAEGLSAGYERVTRYLGLVTLVALTLAAVACATLFRAFLRRRVVDLAILRSLGARRSRARTLLLLELALLGAAAVPVAAAAAAALLALAGSMMGDVLPDDVQLRVGAVATASALAVALVIGPVSCLPLLRRVGRLRIAELFQEHANLEPGRRASDGLWAIPSGLLLALLAVQRSGDWTQGLGFAAVLLVAFAAIAATARLLLGAAARFGPAFSPAWRLALRQLSPRRRAARTVFVALGVCTLLLSLPAQLRGVLDERLRPPPEDQIPSLFLFDIQPDQAGPLKEHVEAAGTRLQRLAPMVRAQLVAINGVSIGTGDDDAAGGGDGDLRADSARSSGLRDSERLRSRRYNLTWQQELAGTEVLTAGRDFSGAYDASSGEPAEISVEEDFAERIGVGLGETLAFDIQGVPVDGRIVNLRRVDWNSMQPNFFVSFQPGVLEGAPAVWLASVPALEPARREALQTSIVREFPNVSLIDVSRGIERLLGLLDQLQWALAATAATALAVGLALVFAIATDEAEVRRRDVNLMKVLGARHGLLRHSLDIEFALLALLAAIAGTAAAFGVAAAVAMWLVDVPWQPAWPSQVAVLLALPLVSTVAARLAMRGVLREKPLAFLH